MKTKLDRRDRRRARALLFKHAPHLASKTDLVPLIAAALKNEREETGLSAIGYLFAKRAQANALKAFEAGHGKVKKGNR